jgi:serine/threonine protein kinase
MVGGRFRLIETIGEGGMGQVWRAVQEPLNRDAVIKVIKKEYAHDPDYRDRFVREARAIAALSHPNIVHVYDFGVVENGQPYLAMEALKGRTLFDVLAQEGPLEEKRALYIVASIARALAVVHNLKIIHRDLKPDNVFVVATPHEEIVKVLDFGLAKEVKNAEGKAQQSVIVGTPGYMAPEHVQGKEISPAADIYALGLIWWEMLVGHQPYADKSPQERTLQQVVNGVPPPTTVKQRPLAPGHEATLMRFLQKNPADRPADGAAALQLIRNLMEGRVDARSSAKTEQAREPVVDVDRPRRGAKANRAPRRTALLVAAGIGVTGLLVLVSLLRRPSGDAPAATSASATTSSATTSVRCSSTRGSCASRRRRSTGPSSRSSSRKRVAASPPSRRPRR